MLAYWTLFFVAVFPESKTKAAERIFFLFVFILLVFAIGYRFEVGCDWVAYQGIFYATQYNLDSALAVTDPGYALLNWAAGRMGGGYTLVNVISGALFSGGLIVFLRRQPLPILALAIAIPYMVVVVAMGYQRQSIALAFLMVGLAQFGRGKTLWFFAMVLIGALFHKSVLVLLPLGLLKPGQQGKVLVWFVFGFSLWVASVLLLDSYQRLWVSYVDQQMQSEGAIIRVAMNLVAALVFLGVRKRWNKNFADGFLWQWLALAAILSALFVTEATTAVDRMALYLLPLQIVVFTRLPFLYSRGNTRLILTGGIILGYSAVLFVWLNYAQHADCWLPYRNVLFE